MHKSVIADLEHRRKDRFADPVSRAPIGVGVDPHSANRTVEPLRQNGRVEPFTPGAAPCRSWRSALVAGMTTAPIEVAVRIRYGTRDRIIRWPTHYRRLRTLLLTAEHVPLHGLGHLPMWDAPDVVVRRILEVSAPEAVAAA